MSPAVVLAEPVILAGHQPIDPKIKLGSGGRFKKMKAKLAARGARNPGALAAYIGRRAYGAKKFGALSHGHANTITSALEFAAWEHELRGKGGKWSTTGGASGQADFKSAHQMTVAELRHHLANYHSGGPRPKGIRGGGGHIHRASLKADLVAQHETMHRLLAGGSGGPAHNIADPGVAHSHGQSASYSNTGPALEFAMPMPQLLPVSSPYDLVISRSDDGQAVIRHRRGGGEIARIRHDDTGWVAAVGGKDTRPHTRQRGALLEAIGTHNKSAASPYHRAAPEGGGEQLQQQPAPTALMTAYGISNIRALAASTPVVGAGDGFRTTSRDGGGPTAGLGQKGAGIYAKLRKRGFPHERAHNFAKRAERLSARRSGK